MTDQSKTPSAAMPSLCLLVDTLGYETGGGHFWAYLNWALGARALGCQVWWLEIAPRSWPFPRLAENAARVSDWLAHYGLDGALALCRADGSEVESPDASHWVAFEEVRAAADLLVNFRYATAPQVVSAFPRAVLVDIDPGLLQIWMTAGYIEPARHDAYVTTAEGVASRAACLPDTGLSWTHIPPAVSIDHWQPTPLPADRRLTTVSHWYDDEWVELDGATWRNDKRTGFLPFLSLAVQSPLPLRLALCLGDDKANDRPLLRLHGWQVEDGETVARLPWDYERFILESFAEFSWTKPSCQRIPTGWVSDRTLCYLAAGRPAIVQHTGDSAILPDACGLLRFRTPDEAVQRIRDVHDEPEHHAKEARALAEAYFDARTGVRRLLDLAAW